MQQIVVALVKFVLAVRDDAGRRRHRQECFGDLRFLQRRLEIIDVALQLDLPGILDGSDADGLDGGGNAVVRVQLGVEFREAFAVGAAREWVGARFHRTPLKAGQPLQRILRPADRLAELAVADHVDPGSRLPTHDRCDRLRQARIVGLAVERRAALLGAQEFLQLRRPDQAADMGRENTVGAALHMNLVGL